MALSLSNFLFRTLLLLPLGVLVHGADPHGYTVNGVPLTGVTHHWDWTVDWVIRNPDGLMERPVMGINDQWPIPLLNVTMGDRVIINLTNGLKNQSTSMHWHGFYQNGTNDMDGPVGVTQCNIAPGNTMTYNFTIQQPGTYWYHSHSFGQYPDGFRGGIVVQDPNNPFRDQFDQELAITLSDWYHQQMSPLLDYFISYRDPTGAEPVPNSALMNDTQNMTIAVQPQKTYFVRLINVGAFAGQYVYIEDHKITVIEVDGVYTKPKTTHMIYIADSQRYGFLVTTKADTSKNFAIVASMDTSLFDIVPPTLNVYVYGWLVYDESAPKTIPPPITVFDPLDDFYLEPYDGEKTFENVGKVINIEMKFADLGNGASYAFMNDVTYTAPKVPTLYSAISTGEAAANESTYGSFTNTYVLNKGDVIELVMNNNDTGKHPFHLHGHNFQAIARSAPYAGRYDPATAPAPPATPMRRDVFVVWPMGNIVIRWVADNPGVWFFHCHIDWHLVTGLAAVMVEAPLDLQSTLKVPQNHYDNCEASDTLYKGNAAGNTIDAYDLSGQNEPVPPLPSGFTAKGIVALAFSAVAAVLGMCMISWYGAMPLSSAELASAKHFIETHGGGAARGADASVVESETSQKEE